MFSLKRILLAIFAAILVTGIAFYPRLALIKAYIVDAPPEIAGSVARHTASNGTPFFVYFPPGYNSNPEIDYPLTVHLHGAMLSLPASLSERFVTADVHTLASAFERLAADGNFENRIIIAPYDGVGSSMWSDSSDGAVLAETTLVQEILPWAETNLRLKQGRDNRAIQGFSMGGFGATKIGLKFPELFSRIISWDGAIHDWQTLTGTRPGIVRQMFASEDQFDKHSPWAHSISWADQREDWPIHQVFFTGTMEAPSRYTGKFLEHLSSLGVSRAHIKTQCPHSPFCLFNTRNVQAAYAN